MYKNSKLAIGLAAALLIGTASIAQANDNSGDYHGGSRYGPIPGQVFGQGQGAYGSFGYGGAYGYAGPPGRYVFRNERAAPDGGTFVNGVFIPRGTSRAQVPF